MSTVSVFVCILDTICYSLCMSVLSFCVFFFKQKTAYEMRISDWSSDVCSSDLFFYIRLVEPDVIGRNEVIPLKDFQGFLCCIDLADEGRAGNRGQSGGACCLHQAASSVVDVGLWC